MEFKTRNEDIRQMRFENGMTLEEIARVKKISVARVAQILGKTGNSAQIRMTNFLESNIVLEVPISEIAKHAKVSDRFVRKNLPGNRFGVSETNSAVSKVHKYEMIVSNKLLSNGIQNKLMPIKHSFDILLIENNIRIDVKGTSHKIFPKSQKYPFFGFNLYQKQLKPNYCDYYVFYIEPYDTCFVVPFEDIKHIEILRIHYPPKKQSKFLIYENNFSLLI